MMNYSEINKHAADILKKVDGNRQKFLTALFVDLGFNENEVKQKMRIYSTYYFGIVEQLKFKNLSTDDIEIVLDDVQEILKIKFYKK